MTLETRKAFFSCRWGDEVGYGHVIRSIALAICMIKYGWRCYFPTSDKMDHVFSQHKNIEIIDTKNIISGGLYFDLIVIDDYNIDHFQERDLYDVFKKILVIDDLKNRIHNCDILVDQTYMRTKSDYDSLVPERTKRLIGSDFTLLRPSFFKIRNSSISRRMVMDKVDRILVSLGGEEKLDDIFTTISIIEKSLFYGEVDIVLGFSGGSIDKCRHYVSKLRNKYNFLYNVDMEQLLHEADICIGAAGSSMWERCCLGVPTLMLVLSENQRSIAENLSKNQSGVNLGSIDTLEIINASYVLNNLIKDDKYRALIKENCLRVCDGKGVERVVREINGLY